MHHTEHKKVLTASGVITELIEKLKENGGMKVGDMVAMLGERAVSLILILFSLIASLPGVPGVPGFGAIAGIPITLMGIQLMVGSKKLWMPKRVQQAKINPGKMLHAMEKTLPQLKKLERFLKPRWLLVSHPPARNLLGLAFCIMGVLVALPIPLTNLPLGIASAIMALGLLERDGKAITAGLIASFLCAAIIGLAAGGIIELFE